MTNYLYREALEWPLLNDWPIDPQVSAWQIKYPHNLTHRSWTDNAITNLDITKLASGSSLTASSTFSAVFFTCSAFGNQVMEFKQGNHKSMLLIWTYYWLVAMLESTYSLEVVQTYNINYRHRLLEPCFYAWMIFKIIAHWLNGSNLIVICQKQ